MQGRGIRCSRRGGVTEKTRGAGQDGDLSLRALQFTWGKPSPGLWAVTCFVIPRHKEQLLGEAGLAKSKCQAVARSSEAAGRLCRPCLMHEALHEAFQSIHHHLIEPRVQSRGPVSESVDVDWRAKKGLFFVDGFVELISL